jgi:hypothetical protein
MRTLVLLALLPSLALADGRYKRPESATPPVNLSDRTKPIAPKVEEAKPISSDAALAGLAKAEPTRREQEEILVKLVANTPDDDADEKADLLFRLAEHYAKQMRFWRLEATRLEIAAKHLP